MTEAAVILVLILANGFFSGAEIALVSVRKTRLVELAASGSGAARAVVKLREQPERFLAIVQVGITVVGAAAAAYGGASLAVQLEPVIARVSFLTPHADDVALAVVVIAVSYLSVVVGELVPKSLALRSAERYALAVGRVLLALAWLGRPIVWFLTASSNLVLKPFGDKTTFTEARHSSDELQQLVEEAMQAGTVDAKAGEIASRALDLPHLTAAEVMVPRREVISLRKDASPEELRRLLLEHTHSRMPVIEGGAERVAGYVSVKDLLHLAWDQQLITLHDVLRPAHFVPAATPAIELLKRMQTRHNPFAIVVDEHSAMLGIVTLEDLLEEVVGDILSEHAPNTQLIVTEPDGSALVAGTAPIRDVNRTLGLTLPEGEGFTTVAGLCLSLAGRIPQSGEKFEATGVELEIVDASPRRVRSIRLRH
ncbi:MAG: HlyC/CorC family transporter [Myxococcaceae bacterium]|nr:HlyC/CorC family transporter [Myxococcaceae bacterium]